MSKEQINYLLALGTLVVVWLFFHTIYCHSTKICGGMPSGGMVPATVQRFPNPAGMGMQNIQQPPDIAEFLKNQARSFKVPTAPKAMPPAPPQEDKAAKS